MKSHTSDRIKMPPGFWSGIRQLGLADQDIVRKARLPLTIINESEVTATQYYSIWKAYTDLIGDPALGIIKLATAFETAKYPSSVLATYHARDYRDALNRMVRYKRLCPPGRLRMSEEGGYCTMDLDWLETEEPGPPILLGITLACLLEFGRRGTGQHVSAHSLELSESVGNAEALEAYFGCRIRFGSKRNRLTLHQKDLDLPFMSFNEELLEILTPALDQSLHDRQLDPSIADKVKWIMKRSLAGGRPDILPIARELGMSGRTLQRRLTDENTSFKRLLTEARHEQACEYLTDPSLDTKEIAFLLGYEDLNSFYRAFRQWEGDTPTNWRSVHSAS
ncbi:AraC family transcriptional regulator [Paenibacillus lactis]|uniref:AraC family transcriptional regulator n=1 Tax=Paenibacillus lactis TaxID=228574 RepID=UPI001B2C3361|nr:AraC family transcriptional regulator [Paenibacillus lactis]GIO90212.1 AraC family transcriptional regulator [Paenibacillus lactis]